MAAFTFRRQGITGCPDQTSLLLPGSNVKHLKEIMSRNLIKCDSVKYRQGYIEVLGDVHSACVILEVWEIHVDCDISGVELEDDSITDEDVIANTELELSIEKAEVLVQHLVEAIKIAKAGGNA